MRYSTAAILLGIAGVWAISVGPAFAASQTKPGQDGQMQSEENCQAQPQQKPTDENDKTGSITKQLDKCGGVLNPPEVNDPGLVKPAPDTGDMPVVKPGQVPEQAPKDN